MMRYDACPTSSVVGVSSCSMSIRSVTSRPTLVTCWTLLCSLPLRLQFSHVLEARGWIHEHTGGLAPVLSPGHGG